MIAGGLRGSKKKSVTKGVLEKKATRKESLRRMSPTRDPSGRSAQERKLLIGTPRKGTSEKIFRGGGAHPKNKLKSIEHCELYAKPFQAGRVEK